MKILAVVITYYPDKELLSKDVDSFIDGVDKVLIWENTPSDKAEQYHFLSGDKIEYHGQGKNIGISKALNFAWKYAAKDGYDYFLTMDQDSLWEHFDVFLRKTAFNPDAPEGLYGPCVNDKAFKGDFIEGDLITSGMLVSVPLMNVIGGYCEDFFIDAIDTDLIYHARSLGIKTFNVGDCALVQKFGNPSFRHLPFGKRIGVSNYPPNRLYEIFRNHPIVIYKYTGTEELKKTFYKYWYWKKLPRILLGEKGRWKKLKAIIAGARDARKYIKNDSRNRHKLP